MAKKSIFKRLLPLIAICAMSAAIGMTGATVLHFVTLENPIKTPPVKNEIKEEVGGIDQKRVYFENTGETPVFLRVRYAESWVSGEKILPLEAERKGEFGGDTVKLVTPKKGSDDWYYDEASGWLYYGKIIKPGENSSNIVDGVTLGIEGGQWDQLLYGEDYKTGQYELNFVTEIVQYSEDPTVNQAALKELFGEARMNATVNKDDWTVNWDLPGWNS